MPSTGFKVKNEALRSSASKTEKLARDISEIENSLRSIRNTLDSDVRSMSGIDGSLVEICAQLDEEEKELRKLAGFLSDTAKAYDNAEKSIEKQLQAIIAPVTKKTQTTKAKVIPLFSDAKKAASIPPLCGTLSYDPDKYSEEVKQLQKRLNELGYRDEKGNRLAEDGYFGKNTLYAVNKYKSDHKLWNFGEYEGKVGDTTWNHLFSGSTAEKDGGAGASKDQNPDKGSDTGSDSKAVNIDILQEYVDKYVNFTFADSNGNVSGKIQLPYKWGAPGGVGKWSIDEITKNIKDFNIGAKDSKLQSKITANPSKTGIDCSGFVLQVIDKATNGRATEYYKAYFNIPGKNVFHYGVKAVKMTSPECSTKIVKLSDVRPGDYIRFNNGGHIGIVYKVDGNTIYYAHSSLDKGPHTATITVTDSGAEGLDLRKKENATFNDWDKNYSADIQSLFNYICRPLFSMEDIKDKNVTVKPEEIEDKNTSGQYTTYKVKAGDTLSAIAKKFDTTVEELARLNNIKNINLISVGQVLKIPVPGKDVKVPDNNAALPGEKKGGEDNSSQSAGSGEIHVTSTMLEKMGFRDFSEKSTTDLNKILSQFKITTKEQIQYFLGVCLFEGGTDKDHIENDCKNYKNSGYTYYDYRCFKKKWNGKYDENGKKIFEVIIGDFDEEKRKEWGYDESTGIYKYVGAGYIQLSLDYNYKVFSDFIAKNYGPDPKILEIGASYVAEKYSWLASGFWWDNNGMNRRIDEGTDIVEVSRCVNGGPSRQHESSFTPAGMEDRDSAYDKVCKYLP